MLVLPLQNLNNYRTVRNILGDIVMLLNSVKCSELRVDGQEKLIG